MVTGLFAGQHNTKLHGTITDVFMTPNSTKGNSNSNDVCSLIQPSVLLLHNHEGQLSTSCYTFMKGYSVLWIRSTGPARYFQLRMGGIFCFVHSSK